MRIRTRWETRSLSGVLSKISATLMNSLFPDWSTCQLSKKAVCGNGIKTRMLDCVRSDGKSVDLKYCEEVSGYL